MAKAQRTVSVRLDQREYAFLERLAAAEHEDVSKAMRDLLGRGRLLLAVDRYREGKASLGKAAELADLAVGELIDVLQTYGVTANLTTDDYRASLDRLSHVW